MSSPTDPQVKTVKGAEGIISGDSGQLYMPPPVQKPPMIIGKIISNGLLLSFIFWINAALLFGAMHSFGQHIHKLKIAVVSFSPNTTVGEALLSTAAAAVPIEQPTFVILNGADLTPQSLEHLVFKGTYWGAVYTAHSATNSSIEDIVLTSQSVRYSSQWSGVIVPAMTRLADTVIVTFSPNSRIIQHDLSPLLFSARVLLNGVSFVLQCLLQMFMALPLLGFLAAGKIITFRRRAKYVYIVSIVWPMIAALSVCGWFFTFRESFHIDAKMFFRAWSVSFAFSSITFDLITIWLSFAPVALSFVFPVTWVFLSISSVIVPIEAANRFYRICYALPAYYEWSLLITIFGRGAVWRPWTAGVLVAYFVLTKALLSLAIKNQIRTINNS